MNIKGRENDLPNKYKLIKTQRFQTAIIPKTKHE